MDPMKSFCGVTPKTLDKIEEVLRKLVDGRRVTCAMVIDNSGYIIGKQGNVEHVPCEELAAVSAGSFASYGMIARTRETSVIFHTKGVKNLHFARINSNMFLMSLCDEDYEIEEIRPSALDAVKAIRNTLGGDDTQRPRLGSVQFITDKLDEMFKEF